MTKKRIVTIKEQELKKMIERDKKIEKSQGEFIKWVEDKFKEVAAHLYLDFVSITFVYVDQPESTKEGQMIFTVKNSNKYHQMNVAVYPAAHVMWNNGKKENLIDGIIHECSHVHTNEMVELAQDRYVTKSQIMDANEHLTEVVAQYVRALIKKTAPQVYNK